jgi:lysozyme
MGLSQDEIIIAQHLLIEDEGMRQFPYLDCCSKLWKNCTCKKKGKLTIGIGRNLDDVGLSEGECLALNMNDIDKVTAQIERSFYWFARLNTPRRLVVFSMAFNLGIDGFKQFKKMIKCIESGDFLSASNEMLKSSWAEQVGTRSTRLALIMKTGQF